jgi:hypothetical protein
MCMKVIQTGHGGLISSFRAGFLLRFKNIFYFKFIFLYDFDILKSKINFK